MLILIISLLIFIALNIVYYSLLYGITPTPSSMQATKKIIDLIPENTSGTIIELGSGWGNLAFPLAKNFPLCSLKAYEISLIPWAVSASIQYWKKYPNLHIERTDFFKISLRDADVIVCYLYPGAMWKLKDKFEQELKPGTIVVSHTFAVPGWVPEKTLRLDDLYCTPIYLYRVFTKVDQETS